MLTDELKRLGQSIIGEFQTDHSTTTQKWMAHYIAELMQRAENSKGTDIGAETERLCSELILKLWELEKEQEKIRVQSQFYMRLDEVDKKKPLFNELKGIIETPELVDDFREQRDRNLILLWLNHVEDALICLTIFANIIGNIDRNIATEEILVDANEFLKHYQITIQNLKDIWPQVEGISANDEAGIQSFVSVQLQRIQYVRKRLIGV